MMVVKGRGSYTMSGCNSASLDNAGPPIIKNTGHGEVIVRHREYIGDLLASQAFAGTAFPINPGLPTTFPWLSNVAAQFEEWEPRGMLFEYKTTSSDSVVSTNANASLGTVIMATEYNPLNGTFGNKQQMENYEYAGSCKPSTSMLHQVECKGSENPLKKYYVRTGAVPATADQRFYDLGLFQIAASGMQSQGNAIGELWVTYEIALRKPRIQIGQPAQAGGVTDHFQVFAAGVTTVDTTITPATPFGTQNVIRLPTTGSTLGGIMSGGISTLTNVVAVLDTNGNPTGALGATKANTYYFPPGITSGVYQLTYLSKYTTGGANWTPVPVGTNCTLKGLVSGNTISGDFNTSATTSTDAIAVIFVTITKGNASIVFPGTNGAYATPIYADLFVEELPAGIN